ncbi:hypothetical protein [Polaribacter sp. R77954]|uniref:hypothetical protein n=1 Tax=Polaribacter sp. R77954 TaxID=3093870 RepID=UPI0037CBAF68
MKKIYLTVICLLVFVVTEAQSNADIANVYIRRAKDAIESSVDFTTALLNFQKAMKYTDSIVDRKVASLGASVYYEVHHKQPDLNDQLDFLEKAKFYSSQYFKLATNKKLEEYTENTNTFVVIEENIQKVKNKLEKIKQERLKKEKELRRIDSLKNVWQTKSNALSIDVDSIYKFNKNNVALFTKNGFFGAINDLGEILINANEYKDAITFDGFIIFKDQKEEPTKLYSFNTVDKIGFKIPNISDFNMLSTHYGKVMLPRANGQLVTYPNNSHSTFIYDLKLRKINKIGNLQLALKNLKRLEVIDKYKNENEVKIDKVWYRFGGHLGGGVHPLYAVEGYQLKGFLCSLDGRFLDVSSSYQYFGHFYDNKYQAIQGEQTVWVNQNGTKVNPANDEFEKYSGTSKVRKIKNGNYQITKDGIIILRDEKLEKMSIFLKSFSKKK